MPWSQKKTSGALKNRNNNTNDSVMQDKNSSQTVRDQMSGVLSRRLKAISNGDVMTSDGRPFQKRAAETATAQSPTYA